MISTHSRAIVIASNKQGIVRNHLVVGGILSGLAVGELPEAYSHISDLNGLIRTIVQ